MEIGAILNAENHRDALREIESLMTARRGTPEGDRLEILSTLVEDWERRNHPIVSN